MDVKRARADYLTSPTWAYIAHFGGARRRPTLHHRLGAARPPPPDHRRRAVSLCSSLSALLNNIAWMAFLILLISWLRGVIKEKKLWLVVAVFSVMLCSLISFSIKVKFSGWRAN